jgi:single-stranded DNA-specific DHH superfamily exonuclease
MKKIKKVVPAVNDEQLGLIREWSSQPGRKLVFYHNDPDGISAAALWMKAFSGFEAIAREGPVIQSGFIRWIADQDPNVVVFLDLPVDQEAKKLEWLVKQHPDIKIIIIDHHIPDKNMAGDGIVHVNNKFIDGLQDKYLPTAYLVYEMLVGIWGGGDEKQAKERLKPLKWIAGAGIIGDYGQKDSKEFFKGMKSRMRSMERVSDLVSAAVTLKGKKGADRVLKILLRVADDKEFLSRKTLALWKKFVDAEVDKTMESYRKEKEEHKDLNLELFRLRSRLNIVSVISTLLSAKHPKKIIIIYKLSNSGMWKASGRLQNGRLDMGTLFKKAVKGIGTGGGHRQAAGARVKDWERFKRRFLSELGGMILRPNA